MQLNPAQQSTLIAVLERIIPRDEAWPGAVENGVMEYLSRQFDNDLSAFIDDYRSGLDALQIESQLKFQARFETLDEARQDALLSSIECNEVLGDCPIDLSVWFHVLVEHTAEGFYADPSNGGNAEGASWRMCGFERRGELPGAQGKLGGENRAEASSKYFDAIVIGAGAGGGVAACVLAEAGHRVLLLERGRDLGFSDVPRDHLRSQRLSLYGHNAGPDDRHPRVLTDEAGRRHEMLAWQGGYNNNAACVGGGTRVYGGQAWRFMAQDFRMASLYGVPPDSALADWPLSYDDLAPWYERVEWELGVAGDSERIKVQTARARPYPLPPVPPAAKTYPLQRGADALGWPTFPVPLAINTVPYGGRAACLQCTECVGFACPTDAKNGTHNTYLPRALATGNCEIEVGAIAQRIETDESGRVVGLKYFAPVNGSYESRRVGAKVVICAAGAIETARLLLHSASKQEPQGLGNAHDLVGRHLQGHYYTGALGATEEIVFDNQGPGVTIATNRWNHGNDGLVGGGMLADDFIKQPIDFWRGALPPDLPRWGKANKAWMRDNYRRTLHVAGPIQDIPHRDARVQLDHNLRDAWGIPVAHLSGTTHPETVRVAEFMRHRAEEWLRAAGCHQVWSYARGLALSAGQHQAGTCRIGTNPQTSVCDRFGRVHNHDNLFVCDGSLHVTNGGFNPFLTIMALSARNADFIARQL